MKINKNIHFTTGEFAKLCKTSKQTLYHYDQVGIFSPEIKGDNNYRYYSYQQLETFGAITMLKDIGMPLKEIKEYLSKRNPNELINLLEKERINVINKIDKLNQIKLFIDRKIEYSKDFINNYTDKVSILPLQEEYIFISKVFNCSTDKEVYEAFSAHIGRCEDRGIAYPHFLGEMLEYSDIANGNYLDYKYIYNKLPNKEYSNFTKAKGLYIVAYHRGSYYNTSITYNKILKFIEENNLSVQGHFYEDIILDDLAVQEYDDYVIKISIKVNLSK